MKTRPRILVVGDSLSIPRASVAYEDTWVYKLKMTRPSWDVIALCEGSRTTQCLVLERASTGGKYLDLYRPDAVILQLGIVDCSPRLFPVNSTLEKLLRRAPDSISKRVVDWIKMKKGRKPEYAYVLPDEFQGNLEYYLDKCIENKVKQVVVVAIAYPDERMISKSPAVVPAIERYNKIYRLMAKKYDFVRVVEPLNFDISNELLYEDDGYHFNAKAHELVWLALAREIEGISS